MKHLFVALFFLFQGASFLHAQESFLRFFKITDEDFESEWEMPRTAVPTPDGGFIVAYSTLHGAQVYSSMGLMKLALNGAVEWGAYIEGEDLLPQEVLRTEEGNYLIAASTVGGDAGDPDDLVLLWFSPQGTLLSFREYGRYSFQGDIRGIISTPEGYLFLLECWTGIVLMRCDKEGEVLAAQRYTAGDSSILAASGLARDSSGALCITGRYYPSENHEWATGFITILNPDGSVRSAQTLQTDFESELITPVGLEKGGWLIAGNINFLTRAQLEEAGYHSRRDWKIRSALFEKAISTTLLLQMNIDGEIQQGQLLSRQGHRNDCKVFTRLATGHYLFIAGDPETPPSGEGVPDLALFLDPGLVPLQSRTLGPLPVRDEEDSGPNREALGNDPPQGILSVYSFTPAPDGGGLLLAQDHDFQVAMIRYVPSLPFPCLPEESVQPSLTPAKFQMAPLTLRTESANEIDEDVEWVPEEPQIVPYTPLLAQFCPNEASLLSSTSPRGSVDTSDLALLPNTVRSGKNVLLEFESEGPTNEMTITVIRASSGEVVRQLTGKDALLTQRNGGWSATVSTDGLSSGIYLVRVAIGKEERRAKLRVE